MAVTLIAMHIKTYDNTTVARPNRLFLNAFPVNVRIRVRKEKFLSSVSSNTPLRTNDYVLSIVIPRYYFLRERGKICNELKQIVIVWEKNT